MKKYFFGYLFVRIAKLLAVLTVLAGGGYALFRLEQASIAAQSASYQPSLPLKENLARLGDTLPQARQLVGAFCEQNGGSAPAMPVIDLPGAPGDNDGFARLSGELARVDGQRRQLKEALVTRFDALVGEIQDRLRAHAAAIAPAPPPSAEPPVKAAPVPAPRPPPARSEPADTLYTGQVNNFDLQQRTTVLDRGKELLKVLEASAENPDNRRTLTDSVAQLDALSRLLPAREEGAVILEPVAPPERSPAAPATPRRELNAEKVADQLGRLRWSVRQALLTAWSLDAAYARVADLADDESARCRVATLTVKGIWVAAFGQLALALVAALFVAFLVLVLADFMQTLLDTATNTGIVADAANRSV